MARIVVGTSSWADPGFVADWYPARLPAGDRLPWYAERFEGVELNSSFYAVPSAGQVGRWAAITPPGFTFDVKLHRLLSRHSAQLDHLPPDLREQARTTGRGRVVLTPELEDAMAERVKEAVEPLVQAGKLSAFLLQLSPAFGPRDHELDELGRLLDRLGPHPVAVELRHRGWLEGDRLQATLDWLGERQAALVCVDAPPGDHLTILPQVDAVTREGLGYMRLHGRNTDGYLRGRSVAERFGWRYSDEELEEVRGRVLELADAAGADGVLRVMFNNNRSDDAPTAARRLRELLGQDPGPPVEGASDQLRLA